MGTDERSTRWPCCLLILLLILPTSPVAADALVGDLSGDGVVDALDEPSLLAAYGGTAVDSASAFEPAADLTGDGTVDLSDLAVFGAAWGNTGGDPDQDAPLLFVSLNDLPQDMNDLVVVPPERFQITLALSSAPGGAIGSALDLTSLSVTASEDVGPYPAGSELAGLFTVTPTRAVFEVPAGSDLARTSHYLDVSVRDLAGNQATQSFGYAVRDFASGAPLANTQTIFLDFAQDRSLAPGPDFLEDLRSYGLTEESEHIAEALVESLVIETIVARVHANFGREADGSAGPDPVNVFFTAEEPTSTHSRLCVGGESSAGPLHLGNSVIDVENINEATDTCSLGAVYGVFPRAIRALWGTGPAFQSAFAGVDPSLGGTPIGGDSTDLPFLSNGFTSEDLRLAVTATGRTGEIANALDAFTQVVASAVSHEVGHLLGLTAPGPLPRGLFGGASGSSNQDHNVRPSGGVPAENFLMNRGSSFSFDEMSGRGGQPLPTFRAVSQAYLRDRIVLSSAVTGLYPAPLLDEIAPSPAVYEGLYTPIALTFYGDGFLPGPVAPSIALVIEGDPTPNQATGVQWIDAQTLTAQISPLLVPPGLYDVEIRNGDGQLLVLPDFLEVVGP